MDEFAQKIFPLSTDVRTNGTFRFVVTRTAQRGTDTWDREVGREAAKAETLSGMWSFPCVPPR